MYVEIVPPASPVRTESPGPQERLTMAFVVFAQYRVRAGAEARVANALRNVVAPTRPEVLPPLEDRIRLDLVPFED
jgi:hypothetical protein